jgi:hypothetical protein
MQKQMAGTGLTVRYDRENRAGESEHLFARRAQARRYLTATERSGQRVLARGGF